jgi:hypothetical protein
MARRLLHSQILSYNDNDDMVSYISDEDIFDFEDCYCIVVDRYLYRELSCELCHCDVSDNCDACYDKENKIT